MRITVPKLASRLSRHINSSPIRRTAWTCASCHSSRNASQYRFSSSIASSTTATSGSAKLAPLPPSKPYYVTTPIFYVNASPHIGHLHSMVLADVLKRWQLLLGKPALMSTGTDEHGLKVQRAAAAAGIPPRELCDTNSARFQTLAAAAGVSHDYFARTTTPEHVEAVQKVWSTLEKHGHIYEATRAGWYSVGDECFYPENMVERCVAHMTGRVHMASIETGAEVEWVEEKNYHFRLTGLRDRLLEFYRDNPDWVVPYAKMSEIIEWVSGDTLEDLSISRPSDRLSWGISVPNDAKQVIYVWIDALVNYIVQSGYPGWSKGHEHDGGWPADVHVIGKDIQRFHCIYWPAMLMALGLPLPRRVLSHAHWTMNHKKMSKSKGNVVDPFQAIDRWGVDPMRYFLMRDGGIENDADYSNSLVLTRYKKDLSSTLGNLLMRVSMPKNQLWSVGDIVGRIQSAEVGLSGQTCSDQELEKALVESLQSTPAEVLARVEKFDIAGALRCVFEMFSQTNKYWSDAQPWKLVTKGDEASKAALDKAVWRSSEALRIGAILLQPVLPNKMGSLLDMLGVHADRRDAAHAHVGADNAYGVPAQPIALGRGQYGTLFPPPQLET